jgi:hypothetical protein
MSATLHFPLAVRPSVVNIKSRPHLGQVGVLSWRCTALGGGAPAPSPSPISLIDLRTTDTSVNNTIIPSAIS